MDISLSSKNFVTSGYILMDICGKKYPLPNSEVKKEEFSPVELPFCYKSKPEAKTNRETSLGNHGEMEEQP